MISIKKYHPSMARDLFEVCYSAIKYSCNTDYSPAQIAVWLPSSYSVTKWQERMTGLKPYVAYFDDKVVGYADVQDNGYIDHFFVHADYQCKGVGSRLMKQLIQCINEHNVTGFETNNAKRVKLYAQVSITAKPFFDKYGFSVVRENVVVIKGVELTNFIMENTEINKEN